MRFQNIRCTLALIALLLSLKSVSQEFSISSPNKETEVKINIAENISFSVYKNTKLILPQATISIDVNSNTLGSNPIIKKTKNNSVHNNIQVPIPLKSKNIIENFNELNLYFKQDFYLSFRVYNEGFAYRFNTTFKNDITIDNEQLDLKFPKSTTSLFPYEKSTYSHYEQTFTQVAIDTLEKGKFGAMPILFKADEMNILISEADLYDYPNLFLESDGNGNLKAKFPKAVAKTEPVEGSSGDRNLVITEEFPYIAKTKGTRSLPWRVFIASARDKDLIEQDLVYLLSRPSELKNIDWVKPGKIAWDWYNANNLYDVNFKAGLNTETYKYYIDFAADYGLEYVILDEGWTKSTTEILEFNPEINVKELIAYGKKKNVGIILWCLWKPLDANMEQILDTYADWGAVGIKTDFMQRADQEMVNSYEKIAKECAKRKLLVDFHGAYKPSGLRRAYPNVISYEGVHGNENNKWIDDVTPTHNLILPFTRNAIGPMDYTPGAMRNAQLKNHAVIFDRPMSMGTRAHQAAMYVIYESGLQMLCDSPSSYLKDKKTVEVISKIPTVWDKTKVIEAKIGEYLTIVRNNGKNWYLGSMTDWSEHELDLKLDFLTDGANYEATILKDGLNANHYAEDYEVEKIRVDRTSNLHLNLAKGGGVLIIFKQV
ncbi:alpha-glucosidase [Zunongwangia mangrovi]|uniref:Alpha-glucosidase n=1 Tax=Zunongwangia mangrovi TaxID=1334022 RepID=A0A1I1EBR2_9FLAO|nr:glycoside hydrolase family 97 protein [Zunongwangia mangrovi]SFB84176.1 alpha-glucosidase [Zunongwangia mangrovi]